MRALLFFFSKAITILFILLLAAGCASRNTAAITADPELFFKWFVYPWSVDTKELYSLLSNDQTIDNAIKNLRLKSQADTFSLRLSDYTGAPYTLGIQAPHTVRQDTTYPLIVYLHGGIGSTLDTKGELAYQMLSPLADTFALFIASPSGNRYAPWWSPEGLSRIQQTIRYMTLHYPINPDKIFAAGVSDGATGCYALANTMCNPFAGFFAISGYGGMLQQLGIQLVPSNVNQRPIYDIHAGHDRLYPVEINNQFLDHMQSQGVSIIRKEYPDEQHGFDYRMKEMGTLANYIRIWSRPHSDAISWIISPKLTNMIENVIDYTLQENLTVMPSIYGSWNKDTLSLQVSGIKSFSFTHDNSALTRLVVLTDNKSKFAKVYSQRDRPFKTMLYSLFPVAIKESVYKIEF